MAIYERMTVKGRTGRLQTYESNMGSYTPGSGATARLDDSNAGVMASGGRAYAQSVSGLGDAIRKGAARLEGAYWDYSKSKSTELMNEYRSRMKHILSGEQGILSRKGEAAFTAGDDTLSESKKLRAELLKEYGNDSMVAHMFNNVVVDAENDFHIQAVGHQDREYGTWQDRNDKAAIDAAQDDAAMNYGNADAFAKHAGTAMHHMREMLVRQGYSGEALERGMKEGTSKIFKAGINRAIAANDLASAQRLLSQGMAKRGENGQQYMTGEDITDAQIRISQKKEIAAAKAQAHAAATEARRLRESEAARKKAEAESLITDANSFLEMVRGFDPAIQEAKVRELTMTVTDSVRREKLMKYLNAMVKNDAADRAALVSSELFEFDKKTAGKNISEIGEMALTENLSPEAQVIIQGRIDNYNLKNSDPDDVRKLEEMIDGGAFIKTSEIETEIANRGMHITKEDVSSLKKQWDVFNARTNQERAELKREKSDALALFKEENGVVKMKDSEGNSISARLNDYMNSKEREYAAANNGKPMPMDVYRQTLSMAIQNEVMRSDSWFTSDKEKPVMLAIREIPAGAIAELREEYALGGKQNPTDVELVERWNRSDHKSMRQRWAKGGQVELPDPNYDFYSDLTAPFEGL